MGDWNALEGVLFSQDITSHLKLELKLKMKLSERKKKGLMREM